MTAIFLGGKMNYIDLHCDTLFWLANGGEKGDFISGDWRVTVEKLKQANSHLQVLAACPSMAKKSGKPTPLEQKQAYQTMRNCLFEMIKAYGDTLNLCTRQEVREESFHEKKGIQNLLLALEGGDFLEEKIEEITALKRDGVSILTLTWNYENSIGYPNSRDPKIMKQGLKPFGILAVEALNEEDILIDVSHLSDGGFYDVALHSTKPFIASHSNARSICPHPRNLSDDMIRLLGEKGGVAGLNFYPDFLGKSKDYYELLAAHLSHLIQKGGSELPAIGSDFDGFQGSAAVAHAGEMEQLSNYLKKKGFSEEILEKIWYQNAWRILKS